MKCRYRNSCQLFCTYQTLGSPAGAVLERETTPSHTGSLSNSMHATDKVKSDNTVKSETDKLHNCYPKLPRAFTRVSIKPALRGEGGWERRIQQPGCGAEKEVNGMMLFGGSSNNELSAARDRNYPRVASSARSSSRRGATNRRCGFALGLYGGGQRVTEGHRK